MLVRQVAEVHEADPDRVVGVWPMPKVVRLVRYVVTKWRYTVGPAWSRSGVPARDSQRCGYCAGAATTVDHVTPSSRGGRNTWLNTVAACGGCNQRKGDRTPAEAGMVLRTKPTGSDVGVAVRARPALTRSAGPLFRRPRWELV